jgi:NAD-dependent dihydropyrimidine dehydrogenase PreA subunit
MAHVIVETCLKDNLCYETCPNGSIRPAQDEPAYADVPQLYIDPEECLDCGACVAACPTNSIYQADELPPEHAEAAARNAAFFGK